MQVDLYIETDGKGPKTESGWYGYVLEYMGKTLHTVEGFRFAHGTALQLQLLAICDGLGRLNRSCKLNIHSSNKFIMTALEKYINLWIANDWITAKGEPVKFSALWETIHEELIKHQVTWETQKTHEYSDWILTEIEKRKKSK